MSRWVESYLYMLTNEALLVAAGAGCNGPVAVAAGWEGPGRGGVGLTSSRLGFGGLGGVYCLSGGCTDTANSRAIISAKIVKRGCV